MDVDSPFHYWILLFVYLVDIQLSTIIIAAQSVHSVPRESKANNSRPVAFEVLDSRPMVSRPQIKLASLKDLSLLFSRAKPSFHFNTFLQAHEQVAIVSGLPSDPSCPYKYNYSLLSE
jgi:hypothetical protein